MPVDSDLALLFGIPGYGGGGWQSLRLTTPESGVLLAEWWFNEGAGTTITDHVGSSDITGVTNGSWISQGLRLTNGLALSPSIAGAQTLVLLCKPPRDGTSDEYHSEFRSAIWNGSRMSTTATWHSGSIRGVVPCYADASGTSVYRVSRGNWVLIFCEAGSAAASTVSLGSRFDGLKPTSQIDLAWAAVFSATLTSAERTEVYDMARELLKSRSAYLDWRDCPTTTHVLGLWGQSNAEGRATIANLSSTDQARTLPEGVLINRRDTYATEDLELGVNQTTTNVATQFGPEMPIAWLAEDNGQSLAIAKYAVGSTILDDTAGTDWSIDETSTTNLFNKAMWGLWQLEADLINAGVGPDLKGVCWAQGEQDGTNTTYGAAYEDNLNAFIAKYREQVGDTTADFIIARTRDQFPTANSTAIADVRAAQAAVAAADADVAMFDTDYMPRAVDEVHYDVVGQMQLGRMFYRSVYGGSIPQPVTARYSTFGGVSDIASLGARLTSGAVSTFSFATWIKTTTTAEVWFAGEYTSAAQRAWLVGFKNSRFRIILVDGGNVLCKDYSTIAKVHYGIWQHVGFTFTGGVLSVFMNGYHAPVTKTTDTAITALANVTAPFGLGAFNLNTTPSSFYPGSLKGLGVWNTALTQSQFDGLWEQDTADVIPAAANCLAFYHCEDATSATMTDASGNAKHLTPTVADGTAFTAGGSDAPYGV